MKSAAVLEWAPNEVSCCVGVEQRTSPSRSASISSTIASSGTTSCGFVSEISFDGFSSWCRWMVSLLFVLALSARSGQLVEGIGCEPPWAAVPSTWSYLSLWMQHGKQVFAQNSRSCLITALTICTCRTLQRSPSTTLPTVLRHCLYHYAPHIAQQ
jgi:hypothetical protein